MQSSLENAELAVVENVKWVDRVIWTTGAVAATIFALKVTGVSTFEWEQISISTSSAWLVFLILTVAHFYTALLLIRALKVYWLLSDTGSRSLLFGRISSCGGALVRGISARTEFDTDSLLFIRYHMDPRDPTAWLALFGALLFFSAIVPLKLDSFLFFYVGIALILVQINWVIGSHWIIAICDLARNSEASVYFEQLKNSGIQVAGLQSGGCRFYTISWFFLPAWIVLNALVLLSAIPTGFIFFLSRTAKAALGKLLSKGD